MNRATLSLLALGLGCACLGGAEKQNAPPAATVHLTDGSFAPGALRGSDDAGVLRWSCPAFTRPFEFPVTSVNAVHYTTPGPLPQPPGEYCFELVDDDVLYGNLTGLTDDAVLVESAAVGRLHVRRDHVRRFYRWKEADSIYVGPNGHAGWKESAATPQWRDEGGQLFTEQQGASVFADVGLPEKAVIDVELSWKQRPDFMLALGVDERDATVPQAFHLEVWDTDLVAVGEAARDADMAAVQPVAAGEGRIRVQVYLDQKQKRLTVLAPGGRPVATLGVNDPHAQVHPGLRLTNKKGDVRLEHLRITRWNGLPPKDVRADQARLHRTDGSIVYGRLTAFDAKAKQFTMRDGTAEIRVPHAAVADVFLAPADEKSKADPGQRAFRVVYRDGSRYSGRVERIEDTHLTLACPGVKEPIRLPLVELRSLLVLQHPPAGSPKTTAGRAGRLELEGLSLKGRLAEGREQKDASCLVWQPDLARNASPLRPGPAGRVVYREPPPPHPKRVTNLAAQRVIMRQVVVNGVVRTERNVERPQPPPPERTQPALHLRSGDTIPCEITRIDEKGVAFKGPLSGATFVTHDRIKGVELVVSRDGPQLDDTKRERLLTLPRLQKDTPPSHLICSKNGDFLRGKIVEMDATQLKVEVRLETRVIPRDRVAQIIWLHPDELTGSPPAPPAGVAPGATRVQAQRADGIRLTFVAESCDGKIVAGKSDVLGACRADLAELDQLVLGPQIEQAAAKLAYHNWRLRPAPEPRFTQETADSPDGRPAGTESPLVGQSAFLFKLDGLDGKRFDLADRRGKVIVLDFWATWCGPCVQSMPQIEDVVREFAGQGAELVAVNLEEQPDQIKAMLERHKLKLPVALDRDGVVAARYGVTAIPQTVVIDREGKVARLFVGGGKKTVEGLRTALQDLCNAKPPAPK